MNHITASTPCPNTKIPFGEQTTRRSMIRIVLCALMGLTGALFSAPVFAEPPDFSITGISLGMTLDQVKAALPADFTTEVCDKPNGFSGVTVEGIDVSSQIVTAFKVTKQKAEGLTDMVQDNDAYGIQLFRDKVIYIQHTQSWSEGFDKSDNAPLATKVIEAMKQKYGVIFKGDSVSSKFGYLYFDANNKLFISSALKESSASCNQARACEIARQDFCADGRHMNMPYIYVNRYVQQFINAAVDTNSGEKERRNCFSAFNRVLGTSLTLDYNTGLIRNFTTELIDYTELQKVSATVLEVQKQRLKKEDDAAKDRPAPKL